MPFVFQNRVQKTITIIIVVEACAQCTTCTSAGHVSGACVPRESARKPHFFAAAAAAISTPRQGHFLQESATESISSGLKSIRRGGGLPSIAVFKYTFYGFLLYGTARGTRVFTWNISFFNRILYALLCTRRLAGSESIAPLEVVSSSDREGCCKAH